jgi:hypothetical protein
MERLCSIHFSTRRRTILYIWLLKGPSMHSGPHNLQLVGREIAQGRWTVPRECCTTQNGQFVVSVRGYIQYERSCEFCFGSWYPGRQSRTGRHYGLGCPRALPDMQFLRQSNDSMITTKSIQNHVCLTASPADHATG